VGWAAARRGSGGKLVSAVTLHGMVPHSQLVSRVGLEVGEEDVGPAWSIRSRLPVIKEYC
jgi:hypothetical protein